MDGIKGVAQMAKEALENTPAMRGLMEQMAKVPLADGIPMILAFTFDKMRDAKDEAERGMHLFAGATTILTLVEFHYGDTEDVKRRCEALERTILMMEG